MYRGDEKAVQGGVCILHFYMLTSKQGSVHVDKKTLVSKVADAGEGHSHTFFVCGVDYVGIVD